MRICDLITIYCFLLRIYTKQKKRLYRSNYQEFSENRVLEHVYLIRPSHWEKKLVNLQTILTD